MRRPGAEQAHCVPGTGGRLHGWDVVVQGSCQRAALERKEGGFYTVCGGELLIKDLCGPG